MNRRQFLTLGAVASGTFAVGGLSRMGSRPVAAAASAPRQNLTRRPGGA
jgi:hypothetical protein